MLSIVIPSRTEIFLQRTIQDVLEKSVTDIEVFPILDGYEIPPNEVVQDKRVKYVRLPKSYHTQKRHGINHAINNLSKGKYVMSLDAHCMLEHGWDEVILKDLDEDWIAIPRRHRLDAENWCLQSQSDTRPPIDYEYIMWPKQFDPLGFHGFKWDARTLSRWDIKVDDTIEFQGSCWIMHKSWFQRNGFMQTIGFTGWGQEAEELGITTWLRGGRVVTNKNTYYAHLHKGSRWGRMYFLPKAETRDSLSYAYDYFINNKVPNVIHKFSWLVEKFWPLPGWPDSWQKELNYKD